MKKIILLSILFVGLLSCSKDNDVAEIEIEEPTFTATIETTKTSIDGFKVKWKSDDIITINDVNYKVKEIVGVCAKFEKVDKSAITPVAPYTAKYGNVNDQTYTADCPGSNCPMSAYSETSPNLVFTVSSGVLKLNVKSYENINISEIKVGDYSLNFSTPKTLTPTQESFYIALPNTVKASAANPLKISFIPSDGKDACVKYYKPSNEYTFTNGALRDITISKPLFFVPQPLSGVFSVSSNKKVRFSTGNIYIDLDDKGKYQGYHFETSQYNHHTAAGYYSYVDGAVKKVKDKRGLITYKEYDDNIRTSLEASGWILISAITDGEWQHLIEKRSTICTNITSVESPRYLQCRVDDKVLGLLIFPDNSTWPSTITPPTLINTKSWNTWTSRQNFTIAEFSLLQQAGFVFLPASGRYNTNYGTVECNCLDNNQNAYGLYYSANTGEKTNIKFTQYEPIFGQNDGGSYGCSLRLAKVIEAQ